MRAFTVTEMTPERFVERAQKEIAAWNFGDIADVAIKGDRLIVTFSWMGTSRLEYCLHDERSGFTARLERRQMSPFHAPFKAGFDERFEQVLATVGAVIV